jgi:tRNA threonylcarbamoyladenosine biosynthesis protein TsaE
MDRTLASLEDTLTEAARFAAELAPHESNATLITLSGELGTGKTSFTQGVARALGVETPVTSPTFVLQKIYQLPEEAGRGFARLVHIDAYRLKSGEDLTALGFNSLMEDAKNLIVLEWPERVADALPQAHITVTLALSGAGRTISYGS